MKNVSRALMCLILAAVFSIPLSSINLAITDNDLESMPSATLASNGGWIEETEGVTILHLNGSYYDMGFQHGYLLKNEIQESMRAQLVFFERYGYPYERLLDVWAISEQYLPEEYKMEMQGMADGAEIPFEDVVVLNMMPGVFNILFGEACCEISLWGSATVNGELLHVRSLDWSLSLSDPVTGTPLQENIIMIVRKPEVGYASITPDFAGAITSWNGVNEKGIVIGENSCMTDDTTLHGISPAFRMRMVLDRSATAEEALDILISNRTCGTNFVLSDSNAPIGYALDQTANISYVGTWNDAVEATDPFWQIQDVIRRTPQYIDPECAAVELGRFQYDPSGLVSILSFVLGQSNMIFPWVHYRALSNQIEYYYGNLSLNSTMTALREEYTGTSDFSMFIATRIFGSYSCLCQWVVCPETGGMVVTFASSDIRACYEPIHYFNIYNLINATPP